MKKVKVSEAIGPALDWLVAKVEGYLRGEPGAWQVDLSTLSSHMPIPMPFPRSYSPTTRWSQGGPIIEREKINLNCGDDTWGVAEGVWEAAHPKSTNVSFGPTPLIAAMRCYVASKLGDEPEVPEELT